MPWRYVIRGQQVQAVKKESSRRLRKEMTPEESLLWEVLRDGKLGVKFRRQQVISGFIVDFYSHTLGLVVERTVHSTPMRMIANVMESLLRKA